MARNALPGLIVVDPGGVAEEKKRELRVADSRIRRIIRAGDMIELQISSPDLKGIYVKYKLSNHVKKCRARPREPKTEKT
jgi:hypothetical protein